MKELEPWHPAADYKAYRAALATEKRQKGVFDMELAGKKFGVFGLGGSGKSFFLEHLLKQFRTPFIYRTTGDFDNVENAIIFKPTDKYLDMDLFLLSARKLAINGKIDAILIDDAEIFMTDTRLKQGIMLEMQTMHRNYGLAFGISSKRPQNLPSSIFDSCYAVFLFSIEAPSAVRKFVDFHPGYADLIPRLDYARHNFIAKETGHAPYLCKPLQA